MLTSDNLAEIARKLQTTQRNVIREYIQHLFLSELYKRKDSDALLFKGGTGLRILYESPRYSEDLDFDGIDIRRPQTIDDLFREILLEIERIGVEIHLEEEKRTSGGYLGILHYQLFRTQEGMRFEGFLEKESNVEIRGEYDCKSLRCVARPRPCGRKINQSWRTTAPDPRHLPVTKVPD